MIKVSVVMPIYNAQSFLRESLDSLLGQTLKEIEIICVDDGSKDATGEILAKYAEKNTVIKVIHQENQGAGVARNKGLKEAKGEYLAFFDCDDVYEPNILEAMYNKAKGNNLDVIVCRSDKFMQDTGKVINCSWTIHDNLLPRKEIFSSLDIEKNFFMTFVWWPWDKLYKREFVLEHKLEYQNLRTTNDLYFVACAVLVAKRISWLDMVLVHHRAGGKSSLSVTREKSWSNFHDALVAVKKFMCERGLYSRFEIDFLNYCAHFSLWHLETIWGPSYALLYRKLKNEWFEEFGLMSADKSLFYNKGNYLMVNNILRNELTSISAINSNKFYQLYKKLMLFKAGHGIKNTIKKVKEKLPEYI